MKQRRTIGIAMVCLLLLPLLSGCTSSDDEADFVSAGDNVESRSEVRLSGVATAVSDDRVQFEFMLPQAVDSIQVLAASQGVPIQMSAFRRAGGETLVARDSNKGRARFPRNDSPSRYETFNYPYYESDSLPLGEGRYVVEFSLARVATAGEVRVDVVARPAIDLNNPVLPVNAVYAGALATAEDEREAIRDALGELQLRFSIVGIEAVIREFFIPELPSVLPDPRRGDPLYEEMAIELPAGVSFYFGSDVEDFRSSEFHYARAGAVPGPWVASPQSAIAVPIARAAGPDGGFNDEGQDVVDSQEKDRNRWDEVRILAESLNHELLQYMGVQKLIVYQGDIVQFSDGLSSPACARRRACEDEKAVRENMMYPELVEDREEKDGERFFHERFEFTSDQRFVARHYVGVR